LIVKIIFLKKHLPKKTYIWAISYQASQVNYQVIGFSNLTRKDNFGSL
jgi:hypothetical protein